MMHGQEGPPAALDVEPEDPVVEAERARLGKPVRAADRQQRAPDRGGGAPGVVGRQVRPRLPRLGRGVVRLPAGTQGSAAAHTVSVNSVNLGQW